MNIIKNWTLICATTLSLLRAISRYATFRKHTSEHVLFHIRLILQYLLVFFKADDSKAHLRCCVAEAFARLFVLTFWPADFASVRKRWKSRHITRTAIILAFSIAVVTRLTLGTWSVTFLSPRRAFVRLQIVLFVHGRKLLYQLYYSIIMTLSLVRDGSWVTIKNTFVILATHFDRSCWRGNSHRN